MSRWFWTFSRWLMIVEIFRAVIVIIGIVGNCIVAIGYRTILICWRICDFRAARCIINKSLSSIIIIIFGIRIITTNIIEFARWLRTFHLAVIGCWVRYTFIGSANTNMGKMLFKRCMRHWWWRRGKDTCWIFTNRVCLLRLYLVHKWSVRDYLSSCFLPHSRFIYDWIHEKNAYLLCDVSTGRVYGYKVSASATHTQINNRLGGLWISREKQSKKQSERDRERLIDESIRLLCGRWRKYSHYNSAIQFSINIYK